MGVQHWHTMYSLTIVQYRIAGSDLSRALCSLNETVERMDCSINFRDGKQVYEDKYKGSSCSPAKNMTALPAFGGGDVAP